MRRYPEKNRVGLFRKLRNDGWLVQHYSGGKPYLDGTIINRSSVLHPIYSYGNNYKKYGIEFSLFIWSDESDIAKISKYFDSVVKELKRDNLKQDQSDRYFYLDSFYKGDK